MKKVLIVSPHFPPVNAPDMQRVRMSLPYYRSHGWEPVVLAVDGRCQQGVIEPELERTVPRDVRVVRSWALPSRWARWIGVGNLGLRAWAGLLLTGSGLLRREKFDLVFLSNTQFVTFTLGRIWRRLFGVPYVLDVQDPWRTDFYEKSGAMRPPGGWKYEFARLSAWILEGWSFARASGVMSVSPSYLADLSLRYRWFSAKPSAVIRFGASAADLEVAKGLPPPICSGPDRNPGSTSFIRGPPDPSCPTRSRPSSRPCASTGRGIRSVRRALVFISLGQATSPRAGESRRSCRLPRSSAF